jgi:hypothetical protein
MPRMTAIAEPNTEPFWARARAMFARAVAAIGAPAAIALLTSLPADLRRQIIAWLCPLEHVVRKLLLAEAAELHRAARECAKRGVRTEIVSLSSPSWSARPLPRTFLQPLKECAAGAARSNPDMSRPETWAARFSFALPRDPHLVSNAHAPRIRALWGATPPDPPPRPPRLITEEDAPFRLARRFEALRRVIENPQPHAERLARLIARAVRRFPGIARRYLFAPARTNDYDSADARLGIDVMGQAFDAPDAFSDSS